MPNPQEDPAAPPLTLGDLRFDALFNSFYHAMRQRRMERLERWFAFAVVLCGSGAASALLSPELLGQRSDFAGGLLALAGALFGAAQLAFGFSANARLHALQRLKYAGILARIEEAEAEPPQKELRKIAADMTRQTGEEPPTDSPTSAMARNAACTALGYPAGDRIHIPVWIRLFGWLLPLNDYAYGPVGARKPSLEK
ncbi:hypothetical protein [Neomegalonema sp.]|uniref:hypothetical protein n=1 Tax=Neomegalonema sp. TaxID=2039713 RepID=UPI0026135CD3|nr:hypothetical protein [Neomegalonema sp.]MDD2870086.1 hypothetical protein [Neomegalonema sp.]